MKPLGWIVAACIAFAWMTSSDSPAELQGPVIVDAALASPAPAIAEVTPVVDLNPKAKCKCGDDCKCPDCDGECDLPIKSPESKPDVVAILDGYAGTKDYADALADAVATGQPLAITFYDSLTSPALRTGYSCDLSKQTQAVRDYWIDEHDVLPVIKTMVAVNGKARRSDWLETKTKSVVVKPVSSRQSVRRLSGPSWNWAGADGRGKAWHLANESEHASAGLTIEQLQGLSDRELNAIHDNLHNSGNRNPWGTGGGQLTSLPKVYQQSSGPCPGGNCPSSSRSRGRWGR